jgi:DNA-binding CsgD family transcriptional regulator
LTGKPVSACRAASGLADLAAVKPARSAPLSPRQIEILRLAGHGKTDQEIAGALGSSVHTIGTHVRTIFKKLGARSRSHAIGLWFRR